MKKILAFVLTGAIVAFGGVSLANAGEETQTEEFKITPKKLSKKKPQNIKFVNTIVTSDLPDGSNQPPKATRTVLDLPKQFKLNNKKFAYCKTDEAGLQAAPTLADAKKVCGKKSLVSDDAGSSAKVTVGSAAGSTIIDVDVAAFNENGNKLLLYSKPTGAFSGIAASILVGKLKDSKSGGSYGKALDVTIPPLSAGAISLFEVTIPKSKYIQAKCKPKKLKAQATTTFSNAPQSSDSFEVKCKPKK